MLFSSKNVALLVTQVRKSASGTNQNFEATMKDVIRRKEMDRKTLPVVVQRLVTSGEWVLALRVLSSPAIDEHRVKREDNLWGLVSNGLPSTESKAACHSVLKQIFDRSSAHTLSSTRRASATVDNLSSKNKPSGGRSF